MKRITTLGILLSAIAIQTVAQPVERKQTYYPENGAFVCVNGSNIYSRALYGSPESEWRLETSDHPIFATYKKGEQRNIRFRIKAGGTDIALDSAEWCKASYAGGRRDYELRDKRWAGGTVHITAIAYPDREGAIWKITTNGLNDAIITGIVSTVKGKKFHRYGDLGTSDKPTESFQPDEAIGSAKWTAGNDNKTKGKTRRNGNEAQSHTTYFTFENSMLAAGNGNDFTTKFNNAENYRKTLAGSVVFTTPDPYINTLGGTLVMAADGAWGGKVWMHGAVGWRMPLPGWRAAYAGDFLGMPDRQRSHFDAYAKSMVTGVPVTQPHLMDSANNLARGAYVWGTPMYSNGYICRTPENNHQFHHYDMNLNYIDELLWHFQFDADTAYMRQMWQVLKSHLTWEKNTWDPDGDHLYDAYCCIWASDALQYNSGAAAHSSAYNYRGNLLAARIAEIIGEDPKPYREEAAQILKAMNNRLWLSDEGHWAEFQDFMGLKRLHKDAAVWSIYTPIDCGACTPEQAYKATQYVDSHIPHIPFTADGKDYVTIATSDWSPYEWSINNVAMAEVMHTTLAYYQAGRPDAAYKLLKGTVMDFMYCGSSPGNFGQISHFDVNLGEEYRDFSDVTGISSRTLVEGLFGITPNALNGRCIIRPGFPTEWDSASIKTPYLEYSFKRINGKDVYTVKQNFTRPLQIVIRQNTSGGKYTDAIGSADSIQTFELPTVNIKKEQEPAPTEKKAAKGTEVNDVNAAECKTVDLSKVFNASVTDIFEQKYMSPRSPYTTLALPTQGIGDWCSPKKTANIDDSGLRSKAEDGVFTAAGIPFRTPRQGRNIVFTSLWDNYPDSVTIPLSGRGTCVYLLMAGSTSPMQSHFENGVVKIGYKDGTSETLSLENPSNWCPIEQDYDDRGPAFDMPKPRPYRVGLKTGVVSRELSKALNVKPATGISDDPRTKRAALLIDGGAAEILSVRVNPSKKLRSLTVTTTANDVVIGLMAVTLQK